MKERYATIGTWERIFKEEGNPVSYVAIRNRLRLSGVIGMTAHSQRRVIVFEGYFAESDVRRTCKDLLEPVTEIDFNDCEKVRADLISFAAQLGPNLTPIHLNTANIMSLGIQLRNGEVIKGATYLNRAGRALGIARTHNEANSMQAKALKLLLKIGGYHMFDQDYFENPQIIRADLISFAEQLGEGKTVGDLNTRTSASLSATCFNGRTMSGATYLAHAALALGYAKDVIEGHSKKAQTLRFLKEIAGFLTPSDDQ